jgi:hypothetical protein
MHSTSPKTQNREAREAGGRVKPMAQAMGINGYLVEAREAGERGRSGRTVSVESGESVAMTFGPKGPLLPAKIAAAARNFRPLRCARISLADLVI